MLSFQSFSDMYISASMSSNLVKLHIMLEHDINCVLFIADVCHRLCGTAERCNSPFNV